ncbi:MAG TPA: carboxypeptidase-like regulatory domain-containing protein, partial [Rhodothermales bacterium]|nr:carboxypeptidase-like regulatory domain-containing protein [Rhodothermales bacterium]
MKMLPRHTAAAVVGIALACLFSTQTALGQSAIAGTITDSGSDETLIGVNVIVVGSSAGAATDINGEFQITVGPGEYSVRVSYIG